MTIDRNERAATYEVTGTLPVTYGPDPNFDPVASRLAETTTPNSPNPMPTPSTPTTIN